MLSWIPQRSSPTTSSQAAIFGKISPPISIRFFLHFHIVSENKIDAESNSSVTSRASTRADGSCPTPFPAEPPVICRSRGCQTIAPLVMLLKNLTRSKDKGPNLLTTWSDVKWDAIRIAFHPKVFSCQITNLLMGFFSGHKNVTPPSYEYLIRD